MDVSLKVVVLNNVGTVLVSYSHIICMWDLSLIYNIGNTANSQAWNNKGTTRT